MERFFLNSFIFISSNLGVFTYFNVEVLLMNERKIAGVVIDPGHEGYLLTR